MVPEFESSGAADRIAMHISCMSAFKQYFTYSIETCCGFPSVILEGSEQEWASLRDRAEKLILKRCHPLFAQNWCEALLPLLAKLHSEYTKSEGEADGTFWNAMVKEGGLSESGGYSWFNGWINVFFPYIGTAHRFSPEEEEE